MSVPQSVTEVAQVNEEIDLFDLIDALLAAWRTIVLGVLAGAGVAALGWLALVPHRTVVYVQDVALPQVIIGQALESLGQIEAEKPSQQFSLFGKPQEGLLTFSAWRRLKSAVLTQAQQQLTQAAVLSSASVEGVEGLDESASLDRLVEPIYLGDKASLKVLANTEGVAADNILALRIGASGRDTETVNRLATERAQFVRHVIVGDALLRWREALANSLLEDESRLSVFLAAGAVKARTLDERKAQLLRLRSDNPNLDRLVGAQVLDPKGENAKYLPISVQLMALETEAQALRRDLQVAKEQHAALALGRALVESVSPQLATPVPEQLARLQAMAKETLAKAQGDVQRLTAQQLSSQIGGLSQALTQGLVIDAPLAPTRSSVVLTVTLGGLAAGVVTVLLVLVAPGWRQRHAQRA